MLTIPLRKTSCHHRKQKMKSFGNHQEFLARIAKSLYYVDLPFVNSTSLPVTGSGSGVITIIGICSTISTAISATTINEILPQRMETLRLIAIVLIDVAVDTLLQISIMVIKGPYKVVLNSISTAKGISVHAVKNYVRKITVLELASEIFSEVNKFSLNRLDIEKAAHLSRNACVSPCLLVLALLYLERLKSSNPKYLVKISPTELFLISLMVGSKFLQDDGEGDELSNTEWADLTGLTVQEINKAEKQFLDAIGWEVFVSKEEFWDRFNSLEMRVGLRQGCRRGWFTYTELNHLLQLIDLTTVVQCFWNVTTACLLSYTASVLALVGSTLLVCQITGLGLKPKVPTTEVTPNSWTTSLSETFQPLSGGIQDCNVWSSLELLGRPNATDPEYLNVCKVSKWDKKSETNFLKVFNWDLVNGLYFRFSPSSFLQIGHSIVKNSNEGKPFSLSSGFNVWTWSNYIRNYLSKNPPPGVFYSVASF